MSSERRTFRGQRAWLRVSPFLEHEMSRKAWRGTSEAAAIEGVCKPALLHRIEWHADAPAPVPVSAEVLTLVTDPLASRERFLRTAPDLSADWFGDLSASLAALRAHRTDRRFPYIIELLKRIVTVSLETMKIVDTLPTLDIIE